MLVALALFIALSAVVASGARLTFALSPTALAPEVLDRAFSAATGEGEPPGTAQLERILAPVLGKAEVGQWEAELLAALRAPPSARTGLINEQLSELDHRLQRWARVPRVCASICTSAGFLLAATVLRVSLSDATEASEVGGQAVDLAVLQAINVAAIGLSGAAFCIAIQMRARTAAASQAKAFDRLVMRLERASPPAGLPEA